MTDRRIFLWIASIMTAICLALLAVVVYAAATARADSSCTSTRNGWTYDRCTGVTTPGPDAWTKPGSDAPFVVTLWRRDVKDGPQTREARETVAAMTQFPVALGVPGEQWCGLQWDVTRDGTWLAGAQVQWTCPTPSPTSTTPTSTETTSWTTTASPSPTSSSSGSTSSAPSTTTAPSATSTTTYPTPTSSQPTTTASAPSTRGSTPTTTRHHPYGSSTSPAPTRPAVPAETLADTGEDWQVYAVLAASSVITGGLILVALVRSERDRGGRYRR